MTVETMSLFFALLAMGALMIAVATVASLIAGRGSGSMRVLADGVRALVDSYGLMLAWAIATIATLGSLYYSEIAHYTPCELCWYQRIAMYPLSIVLGIAAFRGDFAVRRYVLPVTGVGAAISIYHYFLQRFPTLGGGTSCDPTAPCTFTWVWEFHFISIPFMALSGFMAIGALMLLVPPRKHVGRSYE